jgi:hypothetical protein
VSEVIPPVDGENSTIRTLRESREKAVGELKAEQEARAALEAEKAELALKLQAFERSQLDEQSRLKLEAEEARAKVAELEPIKGEVERYQAAFKSLYETELASVPDDVRATAEKLTSAGSYPDRLESLRLFKTTVPALQTAGTRTAPVTPPAPQATQPNPNVVSADPSTWGKIAYSDALAQTAKV